MLIVHSVVCALVALVVYMLLDWAWRGRDHDR